MANNEIDLALTITRVGMDDLALEDPANGYELVNTGPGMRTWRRDYVEGTYVHGRTLLNAVLETRTMPLVVRVMGDTWQEVATRAQVMFDAVSQFVYLATLTMDDVVYYFVCEPADIAISGQDTWDKHRVMACQQEYVLSIPYDPLKVGLS